MRIDSAQGFVDYWRNVRQRTRSVIERITPDDLEWTYAPDRWSMGDIARHLAGIERDTVRRERGGTRQPVPGS